MFSDKNSKEKKRDDVPVVVWTGVAVSGDKSETQMRIVYAGGDLFVEARGRVDAMGNQSWEPASCYSTWALKQYALASAILPSRAT